MSPMQLWRRLSEAIRFKSLSRSLAADEQEKGENGAKRRANR